MLTINEIKPGMRLVKDVQSKLGGILYRKGSILKNIDREIFEAFGVAKVEVEVMEIPEDDKDPENKKEEQQIQYSDTQKKFSELFNHAMKTMDNIIKLAQGNAPIPIMELRKALQPLLNDQFQHVKYLSTLKYDSADLLKYESHHSLSVGIISHAIAKWHGLDQGERMQIALAGALHDIGISRIPSNILDNKGKLSPEEYDEIKKHTLYGYQILKDTKGLSEGTILAVLQHHERGDKSGYPLQLNQDKIHLYAKIVAIADIFHAMISRRRYRSEFSPYQAIDQIIRDGFGKLDPVIVRVLTNMMTQFANGTKIELSDGQIGTIVFIDQQYPTRPWVKVDETIINLVNEKQLFIAKVL